VKEEGPHFPEIPNEISVVVGSIRSFEQLPSSARKVVFRLVGEQGDFVLKKTDLGRPFAKRLQCRLWNRLNR
jgi:hypothetical protein